MVKKLTALLFCALFITGAALAADTDVETVDTMKNESKSNKRSRSYRKNKKNEAKVNEGETVVATEDVYTRGRYNGGSCSTGTCGQKSCNTGRCGRRHESHSHACREGNCGVCSRKAIPNKPCCEKAVTVRTEPCLHKHVEYSWTCPVDYTETACPTC